MTNHNEEQPDRPAILGGTPVCETGPPEWPFENRAVAEALQQTIVDRTWGKYHGPNCEELSQKLTEYHGSEHAVLCASGTAAVEMALRGLKVGVGHEVILAGYDFKGNFQDILTVGAIPVLVDLREDNWNLDVEQIESAITEKTTAIIATHLHGGVVNLPRLIAIASERNIPVIEDACQLPGASLFGRKAGMWGDVGILSFGGSKLLSAGRGGAFITNQEEIVQRARLYSHRGNEAYPLSELQAAVLLPQLEQLDEHNKTRSENVSTLFEMLSSQKVIVPFTNSETDIEPGYYKLGFQYNAQECAGLSRDSFATAIRAEGIALDAGFRSLHKIHSKRRFRAVGDLTVADRADENVLVLHHPVLLQGEEQLQKIVTAIDKVVAHAVEIRNHFER